MGALVLRARERYSSFPSSKFAAQLLIMFAIGCQFSRAASTAGRPQFPDPRNFNAQANGQQQFPASFDHSYPPLPEIPSDLSIARLPAKAVLRGFAGGVGKSPTANQVGGEQLHGEASSAIAGFGFGFGALAPPSFVGALPGSSAASDFFQQSPTQHDPQFAPTDNLHSIGHSQQEHMTFPPPYSIGAHGIPALI